MLWQLRIWEGQIILYRYVAQTPALQCLVFYCIYTVHQIQQLINYLQLENRHNYVDF
jgi:hypothetical protein